MNTLDFDFVWRTLWYITKCDNWIDKTCGFGIVQNLPILTVKRVGLENLIIESARLQSESYLPEGVPGALTKTPGHPLSGAVHGLVPSIS